MTFYCVHVEFYDNFDENDQVSFTEVKACITSRQAKIKPKNYFKQSYGITAFRLWVEDEQQAKKLREMAKNGDTDIYEVISFYQDCLPLEGRAA